MMKILFGLLAISLTLSAWSFEMNYPVKNFKYISDWDYREEVQYSDKYVVMIFSSKACLERTIVDRSCFLFEKKLDQYIPSFSSSVKIVGFNTYFENYQVTSQFNVIKFPSIIIMKDNQILKRIEPSYQQDDLSQGRLNWQDELLRETLSVIYQIR